MEEKAILVNKRVASARLGVSVRTLENLIAAKEISVRKIGRRVLLEVRVLESFSRRDHSTV